MPAIRGTPRAVPPQLDQPLLWSATSCSSDDRLMPAKLTPASAEALNLAEQRDIAHAVAPPAAGGSPWLDEPHPVVLAQRLWMHAGHPRRHRDDENLRIVGGDLGEEELRAHVWSPP
jgi:hypothetical protein